MIPIYHLGQGTTPVQNLERFEAEELAEILLADDVRRRKTGGFGGKHIAYPNGLPKHLRGSDKSERIYASVKILMRAGLREARACRKVAEILGSRIGKSKRGKRIKKPERRRRSPAETVRSLLHGFERSNPWPPSEDAAEFRDPCVEKWFSHAWFIGASRRDIYATPPPDWQPGSMMVQIEEPPVCDSANPRSPHQSRSR